MKLFSTIQRTSKTVLTLSLLAGALSLGACAHKEAAHDQAAQPPSAHDQAMTQMQADRDAYVQRTTAKVSEYQKHAQDLRTQASTQPKPQNKKLENAAEDLDSALRDVNTALTEVKTAAPANWLDYKRDVEKALNRADAQFANSTSLLR